MDESNFLHAKYNYNCLNLYSYIRALLDLIIGKIKRVKNITFHLPIEICLPSKINLSRAKLYLNFVEMMSRMVRINVVWENIAFLSTKDWSIVEQSTWDYVPKNINLCLDTGHLILNEKNPRKRILEISKKYDKQIKHLHIHENDLLHDLHLPPKRIIDKKTFKIITKGRTWIIETSS